MRHKPLGSKFHTSNRQRLGKLLPPKSLAVLNANDILPTNADGSLLMRANSDLFYLTGVEQEESVLVLFPDACDENLREVLFLREPSEQNELWEGRKLRREEAQKLTGIKTVKWLREFWCFFRGMMCEVQHVYLNTNEHRRAADEVETRDDRFIRDLRGRFPLHDYRRLAPLMHGLRLVKSDTEIAAIRHACDITAKGFKRVLRRTKPGLNEADIEAEFAHEFIRSHSRFAYEPIVGTGLNACCLHYQMNNAPLKAGEIMLLDVGAAHANYNADMTRAIPVDGKFSRRQRAIYDAVLRVLQKSTARLKPGMVHREWQKAAEADMTEELLALRLLTPRDVKKQDPEKPAVKKYFMHGLGHTIGLDVHDVGDMSMPMQIGWVMTVEPGLYLPKEKLGIRLENTVLITESGPVNLMENIPIEAAEIEAAMR